VSAGILDVPPAQLESPGFDTLLRLITQPGEQAKELQQALVSVTNADGSTAAAADVAVAVVDEVARGLASRAGVDVDVLFPMHRVMLQQMGRSSNSSGIGSSNSSSSSSFAELAGVVSSSSSHGVVSSSSRVMSSSEEEGVRTVGSSSSGAMVGVLAAQGSSSTTSNGRKLAMRQL
jgi:cobalamin biosynthesis Mg chelatase CobN